jgi:hypothetical protein
MVGGGDEGFRICSRDFGNVGYRSRSSHADGDGEGGVADWQTGGQYPAHAGELFTAAAGGGGDDAGEAKGEAAALEGGEMVGLSMRQ